MNVFRIDLYAHFGLSRPVSGSGYLDCFLQNGISYGGIRQRPAVLVIPGGGYASVSDREGEPIALRFLARGYCAFVLQYSVAPVGFPHALREAAMAMRYIREQAEDFGIAPNMVAATGFSAGGHLCGLLGTLFDGQEVADIGSAEAIRPDALGLCYPVAVSWGRTHEGSFENLCGEDAALRARLSLEKLVRSDMPPVFLWHTGDDGMVPCRNSLILAQALEEKDIPFAMHIYRSGQHGLSTADEQVYPADKIPAISGDVPGWLEAEMGFFREMGLKIRDFEVCT